MGGTVRIGPKGRVVIPVEARRALHLDEGDELCLVVREDSLELMTRDAVLARLREMGTGGSLVDELISERRAAAAAEAERWSG